MPNSQRKIVAIGGLLILLAAVYVFGFSARPANAPAVGEQPLNPAGAPASPNAGAPAAAAQPAAPSAVKPGPAQKPAAESSTEAMLMALANNFKDALASAGFPKAGVLKIDRVWLVGSQSAYVEYTDSSQARRALIEITAKNPLKFKAVGYFVPGGNDWMLEKGQDKIFKDQVWTLYEFDSAAGVWQKQN